MRISKEFIKEIADSLRTLRQPFSLFRKAETPPDELEGSVVHVDFVRKTVESDKRSANE